MKDFDITKYLREHQLGSYGILNHYVDLKPLKEEDDTTEVELNTEIPYEGPEPKLTGNGEGDEFEQAETVSEEEGDPKEDLAKTIEALKNMGYTSEEIRDLLRDLLYPDYSDESID